MSKEIVRLESPEDPGERSRLWSEEDIVQVLEENTGTSRIEIIFAFLIEEVHKYEGVKFGLLWKSKTNT
ncbi:hypothetical protein P8452_51514 [Trifolium repens]|nr:hypothetical protein P8452_51514 [Trifolium repens]